MQRVTAPERTVPDSTRLGGVSRRRDIQGLRALAVLSVILFHAGLPLPGGFVGVDVFFVISGFVITAMLQREFRAHGRLDFARFYIRRFARLTPALAVMVTATLLASILLLSPFDTQQNAAKTAIGAMLLAANFVIARTTGDYFDAPAESNPLLHTWSLSVEEQFYVLFPWILALCWLAVARLRRGRALTAVVVSAVALVSFLLVFVPDATGGMLVGFYSPLTRVWEFAAGALVALAGHRVMIASRRWNALAGLVGLGMVAASLWLINSSTLFPGPATLLPVVGTVLLIIAGTVLDNPVSAVLSSRPMKAIGDWSYSLYLWHWPFIVFAGVLWPGNATAVLVAALLSVLPALASYYWIETPLRSWGKLRFRAVAPIMAVVIGVPVALGGATAWAATNYWMPQYAAGAIASHVDGDVGQMDYLTYVDDTFLPCTAESVRVNADVFNGITRCHQSQPGDVQVAIVGDSHAEHLFLGLAEALPDQNVAYYTQPTPTIRDVPEVGPILDFVEATDSIQVVIVTSYWGTRGVPQPGFEDTLRELVASGKTVYVTNDVPDFPFDAYICKYGLGMLMITRCTEDAADQATRFEEFAPELQAVVDSVPGVRLLDTARYFCDPSECSMVQDGQLMYRDNHHLGILGSRYVAAQLLAGNPGFAAELHAVR